MLALPGERPLQLPAQVAAAAGHGRRWTRPPAMEGAPPMFDPKLQDVRRFFCGVWRKHLDKLPLEPHRGDGARLDPGASGIPAEPGGSRTRRSPPTTRRRRARPIRSCTCRCTWRSASSSRSTSRPASAPASRRSNDRLGSAHDAAHQAQECLAADPLAVAAQRAAAGPAGLPGLPAPARRPAARSRLNCPARCRPTAPRRHHPEPSCWHR